MNTVTPIMAREKLMALGITSNPTIVMEIVRHLKAGGTQYALYNRPYSTRVASNNTVLKIKNLLVAGKLDSWIDECEDVLDEMKIASDEEEARNLRKAQAWDRRLLSEDGGNYKLYLEARRNAERDTLYTVVGIDGPGVTFPNKLLNRPREYPYGGCLRVGDIIDEKIANSLQITVRVKTTLCGRS
jgi:hypothetical protein